MWPIDGTITGITTPGQSEPESKGLFHIPQSSRTEAIPSDAVYCHNRILIGMWSYSFAKIQLVYFIAPAHWAVLFFGCNENVYWGESSNNTYS